MHRRDFIRMLAAFGFTPEILLAQRQATSNLPPPAPVPWTLGLNGGTPVPQTETADALVDAVPAFFSAEQMGALTRLSDLLLPELGDWPGALDAEVPAFLDFLIGISPEPRQKLYTGGLDWLNSQAQQNNSKRFADLSSLQADAIVKPWLRTWMSDHPPTELHADFINIAHADIRTATLNSKVWFDAQLRSGTQERSAWGLYWSPIEPDIYAEEFRSIHARPSPAHAVGAPKASHTTRSFPQ